MKKIILVVDDDRLNLMMAQKLLSEDYRVAAVNSGELALHYLEKKHTGADTFRYSDAGNGWI